MHFTHIIVLLSYKMAEFVLLGVIAALGVHSYRTRQISSFHSVDLAEGQDELPTVEAVRGQPYSIPWDDINQGEPLPQVNRMIQMNRPLLWAPKSAVAQEPPRSQRDPLYPDDLRAYDTTRSRLQHTLADSNKLNYEFGGYHMPHLPQDKTKQEVAQSAVLAGRINNPYTSGTQHRNAVVANTKDPSAQVTRQRADHVVDDRSTSQVWSKKQHAEMMGDTHQDAVPNKAAIQQPNEYGLDPKSRAVPKYINTDHAGWANLPATTQRAEIQLIEPTRKKKVVSFEDDGHRSSTQLGGYSNALRHTQSRRRDLHPEVSTSGVFQGGTGRSFLNTNSGQHLDALPVNGQRLWPVPHITGEKMQSPPPWVSHNPTNDHVTQPRGEHAMWSAKALPTWQADNAHSTEITLLR